MIYLASPYTHPDPFVRYQRYITVLKALTEQYFAKGVLAYSPIVHGHPVAVYGGGGTDWETWKEHSLAMIRKCDEVHILRMDGWETSKGVAAERLYATEIGKMVRLI